MPSVTIARLVGGTVLAERTTPVHWVDVVRGSLTLLKPRIVSLVLFTSVAACVAAAAGAPPPGTLGLLLVSGFLSTGGAAALNHYLDRDVDARMARTRSRPLASHRLRRPTLVLFVALTMVALGVLLARSVNDVVALCELAGALVYAGVYTVWLKRRTPISVVVGGSAGSLAVLGGWAAVEPALGPAPWLLAGIVFFWTPAHFWCFALANRSDYAAAGVPILPRFGDPHSIPLLVLAHAAVSVALSFAAGGAGGFGLIYYLTAGAGAAIFLVAVVRLVPRAGPAAAWHVFKLSGVYLGLVFLGLLADALTRIG